MLARRTFLAGAAGLALLGMIAISIWMLRRRIRAYEVVK